MALFSSPLMPKTWNQIKPRAYCVRSSRVIATVSHFPLREASTMKVVLKLAMATITFLVFFYSTTFAR